MSYFTVLYYLNMRPQKTSFQRIIPRKTYVVNDDLEGIKEFWGQILVAVPAPSQAKLEFLDPEGTDSVN